MNNNEKKLSVMLALKNMSLKDINTIMNLVKSKKDGIKLLIEWLNETDEQDSQLIIKKAKEFSK